MPLQAGVSRVRTALGLFVLLLICSYLVLVHGGAVLGTPSEQKSITVSHRFRLLL